MPKVLKILGQSAPSATTETDLYTVPAATTAVASSLIICNRGASSATVRISCSVAGAATANKDYIYYDLSIPSYDTFIATVGLSLGATDKVRVYASTANVSFSLYGQENS